MTNHDVEPRNLDDPRTPEQRCMDAAAARRQAEVLVGSPEEDAFLRLLTRSIQERRATRTRDDVTQFEVLEDGRRGGTPVVTGQLLVRDTIDPGALTSIERLVGAAAAPVHDIPGLLSVRNPDVPARRLVDIARAVRSWGHQASVTHVTPLRGVAKGRGGPEPTQVSEGYRLQESGVPPADRVRVAVIDTGVAKDERKDGFLAGMADPAGLSVDPLDAFPLDPGPDGFLDFAAGHGSFVAGIVQQVAADAAVSMHRALDSDGVGSEVTVGQAIVRAVRDGKAQIVNLSLGAQTVDDQPLLAIEVALEHVDEIDPEVLVFAAAGNYGDTTPCFPAAQRRVVAVAALAADESVAAWSSRGFWVTCATIGEGIVSTYVHGEESPALDPQPDTWPQDDPNPWAVWCGTSFAAPQVAGEVARRMQDDGQSARQALAALLASGSRKPDVGHAVRILPGTIGT